MSNRRWYLDAALILIVIILGVLVVMQFTKSFDPANEETQPTATEEIMAGDENGTAVRPAPATSEPVVIEEEQDTHSSAPDFTLTDLDGNSVSLSDYRGTPVMLNFWATWCPPCRAEMPLIQEYQDKYADGFVVLAVNGGETAQEVQAFVTEQGFDMVFLLDADFAVAELYQVRGFPTSVFIGADGNTQKIHIGELNEPLIVAYLELLGLSE